MSTLAPAPTDYRKLIAEVQDRVRHDDRYAKYGILAPPAAYLVPLLDEGRVEDALTCYVFDTGRVGFPEVVQIVGGAIPTHGNLALMIQPNVVIWRGMSGEFVQLVLALIRDGRLVLESTAPCSESYLGLPMGRYPLSRQYSRLRHLAADFNLPCRANPTRIVNPACIWMTEGA